VRFAGLYDATGTGGRRAGRPARRSRFFGARWRAGSATSARVLSFNRRPGDPKGCLRAARFEANAAQPEFLAALEADVHLVADLIAPRSAMPDKAKDTARQVVAKVVWEVMEAREQDGRGHPRRSLNKQKRTSRPRFSDIDWPRTIRRNLQHWQEGHQTIVPERLVGYGRNARRSNLEQVILCVDQSGSMGTSVVYSSIFAAVLASIPAIATKLVVFDTAIVDLTEDLKDPVDVLFGVQLGGGTDINQALAYSERLVVEPARTHLVLISDLYEGGNAAEMLARANSLVASGINLIVLLALNDDGRSAYDATHAAAFASMGCPVFACTPDQFPG
jgi:Mg-chelatase subunit ChlD